MKSRQREQQEDVQADSNENIAVHTSPHSATSSSCLVPVNTSGTTIIIVEDYTDISSALPGWIIT